MAAQSSSSSRFTDASRRVPVEPRALGAILARAGQLRGLELLVETDRYGNTQAWVERRPTR